MREYCETLKAQINYEAKGAWGKGRGASFVIAFLYKTLLMKTYPLFVPYYQGVAYSILELRSKFIRM